VWYGLLWSGEMNDKNTFIKALFLCLVFVVIVSAFGYSLFQKYGSFNNSGDYKFHEDRAQGFCAPISEDQKAFYNEKTYCDSYPLGLNLLTTLFGHQSNYFFFFMVLLLFLVIPMLLFRITNSFYTAWFYLTSCAFAWNFLATGYFPQMLIFILFLLFLLAKNHLQKTIILILALSIHFYGFLFIFIAFFIETLLGLPYFKKCFACIPLTPSIMKAAGLQANSALFTLNQFLVFLLKGLPFPFLFFGLKGLWQKKNYLFLTLIGLIFISVFFSPPAFFRMLLFTQPLLIIGLTHYFNGTKPLMKKGLLMFSLLVFFYEFFSWEVAIIESLGGLC
jgi:hypothetical protein